MTELHLKLRIKNSLRSRHEEAVECQKCLRTVEGKRAVYEALWDGRPVIVKIFAKGFLAYHRLIKEWRGLGILQRHQLNSPEPLFFGQTADGRWAVVTEKFINLPTALDVFNDAKDEQDKLKLLVLVCKELALQNGKGIMQKDLHLGNFLVSSDTVYSIDPARMRFFKKPLTKDKSVSQLALLACYLIDEPESVLKLAKEYFCVRLWSFEKEDEMLLKKKMEGCRKWQIKRSLKKSLRTSKRQLLIESGKLSAVFDKSFIELNDQFDFINQIDSLMDKGRVLKSGNTCYVSASAWNGHDIVIKRYNHKGFLHSLRHTIKGSRARRSWVYGHHLRMLNIATPKPLAFIEKRKGPIVWQSYIVTEYIEGQKLYDFLMGSETKQRFSQVSGQLESLMGKLAKYRITHGDLKHTNILITADGIFLTDLDSMRFHKSGCFYKAKRIRDFNQFIRFANSSKGSNHSSQEHKF